MDIMAEHAASGACVVVLPERSFASAHRVLGLRNSDLKLQVQIVQAYE